MPFARNHPVKRHKHSKVLRYLNIFGEKQAGSEAGSASPLTAEKVLQ